MWHLSTRWSSDLKCLSGDIFFIFNIFIFIASTKWHTAQISNGSCYFAFHISQTDREYILFFVFVFFCFFFTYFNLIVTICSKIPFVCHLTGPDPPNSKGARWKNTSRWSDITSAYIKNAINEHSPLGFHHTEMWPTWLERVSNALSVGASHLVLPHSSSDEKSLVWPQWPRGQVRKWQKTVPEVKYDLTHLKWTVSARFPYFCLAVSQQINWCPTNNGRISPNNTNAFQKPPGGGERQSCENAFWSWSQSAPATKVSLSCFQN